MAVDEASEGSGGGAATAKGTVERQELGKRRQLTARRAAEAKATIPHSYLSRRLLLRGEPPSPWTGLARLIAATGGALRRHPGLNAAYRDRGIERYSRVNVGFTLQTPSGILAPTLFDADAKAVEEIEAEIEALNERAGSGSLASPELSGGTFTVTAVDTGADAVAPIVSPGQCAHLGAGRARPVASCEGEAVRVAVALDLTLSCDQRAVAPAEAAAFLGTLAELHHEIDA